MLFLKGYLVKNVKQQTIKMQFKPIRSTYLSNYEHYYLLDILLYFVL